MPIVLTDWRAMPRTSAAATAMPAAAEVKLWIVSATIWEKYDIVDSPEELCQLVLVAKLAAVLNARCGARPGKPCGLSGRWSWKRRMK